MFYYLIGVLLLILLIAMPAIGEELSCKPDPILQERIAKFGNRDFYAPKIDDLVLKNPQNFSCLLINNMQPITLDTKDNKFWNIIATLRLLEDLTCTRMTGKTQHEFIGKDEEERKLFIENSENGELYFVGYHMSNSQFFLAPIDAQIEIIDKLKLWYKNKSENWDYKKTNN